MTHKLKMPTAKQLGLNLKQILWNHKYKKFKEFQKDYQFIFIEKLKAWLSLNNLFTSENFKQYYQILFYYSFVNYQKELHLMNLLKNKGFDVKTTNLIFDSIYEVDLIAIKQNIIYYLQIKPNLKNVDWTFFHNLKNIAIKQNAIPILAIKIQNNWSFTNLLNQEQIVI